MAYIKKIKLPGSSTPYDIYDAEAYHGVPGNATLTLKAGENTKTFTADATANQTFEIKASDLGLSAALKFKGSKAYAQIIALTDAELGDVWIDPNTHKEYVCIVAKTAGAASWEELGFGFDPSALVTKTQHNAHTHGVTVTGENGSSSVSGSFTSTDNFVKTATGKYLSISTSDVELQTSGAGNALTGVKASATDKVLGEGTGFTVTPTSADSSKMVVTTVNSATATAKTASKATAGTAVARGNADVGSELTVPNVTSNASVTIPNVTGNVASDAIAVAGSSESGTNFASWSGSVDSDGVLTIDFSSAKYKSSNATKTTLGTALTATNTGLGTAFKFTPAVATTNTIIPYSFADVSCSLVDTEEVTVATGALSSTATGASVVTAAIKAVSVAADSADRVTAVTGVAANGTIPVIGGVSVKTQPVASLSVATTTSTGAIQFIESATPAKVTGSISGTAAAQTWSQKSGTTAVPTPQLT